MHPKVLLINASYEPIHAVVWRRALKMFFLGKVEILEVYPGRVIRSVSTSLALPSVVRLKHYLRLNRRPVRFSRMNIFIRDNFCCQYCGRRFDQRELTYDHVTPRSMNGHTDWDNIVTCCHTCNKRKGGRTPRQASMHLIRRPSMPTWYHFISFTLNRMDTPESWRPYLFCRSSTEAHKRAAIA